MINETHSRKKPHMQMCACACLDKLLKAKNDFFYTIFIIFCCLLLKIIKTSDEREKTQTVKPLPFLILSFDLSTLNSMRRSVAIVYTICVSYRSARSHTDCHFFISTLINGPTVMLELAYTVSHNSTK